MMSLPVRARSTEAEDARGASVLGEPNQAEAGQCERSERVPRGVPPTTTRSNGPIKRGQILGGASTGARRTACTVSEERSANDGDGPFSAARLPPGDVPSAWARSLSR